MTPAPFQRLLNYPQEKWGIAASERWVSLCNGLLDYQAPTRLAAMCRERKWELTSAFQKTIRRGDKPMALQLVSVMDSMPEERAYFWRRLSVIACEDVGPADDTLTSFVVACATIFPPSGDGIYDLTCYLAAQMCELSARSRIYCSYSVIELAALKSLPELTAEERGIVAAILERAAAVRVPNNPWQEWQKKNGWRAEGMLKFLGLALPMEMTSVQEPVPPHKMLFDLPSYCFDVHTRVGLEMLHRLVRGVEGAEAIRKFFRQKKSKPAHRALGEVLFFVEGGRIRGELVYEPLGWLEQRTFARQYGMPVDCWLELRELLEMALADGVIDRVREEVLRQVYERENCNQLHQQMTLDLEGREAGRNTTN